MDVYVGRGASVLVELNESLRGFLDSNPNGFATVICPTDSYCETVVRLFVDIDLSRTAYITPTDKIHGRPRVWVLHPELMQEGVYESILSGHDVVLASGTTQTGT